jgi:ABC-2 type transport system ATP-binding protein
MSAVEVTRVSYSYGKTAALRDVDLAIPAGAFYALLGPNGSGKTTLLQILMGVRRPQRGQARLLGTDTMALGPRERAHIGYIAEGQSLPGWMRLEQLEAYLAPLYPTWDRSLAGELRARFELDPKQRIGTLSRGAHMKAALLCALAPRPKLLLMDEPFTGMDALVKDELVRGLLESAGSEGWTVVISSHDLAELELLADWVGFLSRGRVLLSESMEQLHERFRHVDVVLGDSEATASPDWLSVERVGNHMSFLIANAAVDESDRLLASQFPGAARIDVRAASLREIFVGLARRSSSDVREEVAV